MSHFTVKDLMVPLSEYATVRKGATLFEAVLALEKAQEDYDHTKYRHRAMLILDEKNRVVGKLSHLDVLRAIRPQEMTAGDLEDLVDFGFSQKAIHNFMGKKYLQEATLEDLCMKAAKLKVENFMQTPSEGEYVEPETSLEAAIQQMILGQLLSLLVAKDRVIVGILRLSDVFAAIFHTMKECQSRYAKEAE